MSLLFCGLAQVTSLFALQIACWKLYPTRQRTVRVPPEQGCGKHDVQKQGDLGGTPAAGPFALCCQLYSTFRRRSLQISQLNMQLLEALHHMRCHISFSSFRGDLMITLMTPDEVSLLLALCKSDVNRSCTLR